MSGRTCYHCKLWIEEGEAHDCWTTTESALTAELGDDLREAWERLRETAAGFGEQRIYASHSSIMFSRQSCYFFVRPKRRFLEVNVFLGRAIAAPQVRRIVQASAAKTVHVIQVRHRDEVEAPLTDWLEEAYRYAGDRNTKGTKGNTKGTKGSTKRTKGNTKGTKADATATREERQGTTPRTAHARAVSTIGRSGPSPSNRRRRRARS